MNHRTKQLGFSAVELIIIIVVAGLLVVVGYTVYGRQQNNKPIEPAMTETGQSAVANDVPAAPDISDASDLDEASATLDQINPGEDGDASQIEEELNALQL
jgi:hypothetical protein